MRLIEGADDIAEGAAYLARIEPRFDMMESAIETIPLRRRPDGYAGLLRIITGQQVSVASADAVWRRLEQAGLNTADAVAAVDEARLRACGLSKPKARYAMGIARSGFRFDALRDAPDDEAERALTDLVGVGPWTAHVYLIFCLGRADVFAPGDLAVQESARMAFDLGMRPDAVALGRMAGAWKPWRAVAVRLLWAYYAVRKQREGVSR